MSIQIIGMEMPQHGEFKHIRIYENGEVTAQVDTGEGVYEAVIANAVSIPPHGRPVVLCRDCQYFENDCGWCGYFDIGMNANDFCSHGKREES